MKIAKVWSRFWILAVVALLISACSSPPKPAPTTATPSTANPPATEKPEAKGPARGGDLHFASDEAAPTLDVHRSGVTATTIIAMHLYEGLYTLNAKDQPVPLLAASHTISADGTVYTFELRKGVKFHNGAEMTSADVVASLKRWGEVAGPGTSFFKNVASLSAPDAHTVTLELKEPSGVVLVSLATPNQAAAIYPKDVVEAADPKEGINSFIGTGPYRFVERIPDQHIKLTRFDGYQPVSEAPNGLAGERVAYVDNLYFHHVSDPSIRVAGVETGQYQFADFIPTDEYPRLKDSNKLDAIVTPPRGWDADVFNLKQGPMANVKLRQAWLAALNVTEVALSQGQPEFYRADPSIMLREMAWHSAVGLDVYTGQDPNKAKQLLQEANYDGTPIRWMISTAKQNFALAAKQQLEAVGFQIDLQVMEWATVVQRRANPELWDVFATGYVMRPDPTDMAFLSCATPPHWCDEKVADLVQQMRLESDFPKRFGLWEQIQTAFYEQVPIVKYTDYANLRLKGKSLQGYANHTLPFFWNVWFAKE